MGREQTLLDRIASRSGRGRTRQQATTIEDLDALMESVRKHLRRLLNARHGMSEALPDYGLPALTDLTVGSGNYVEQVRDSIRVAVEKYEPRLRRIRVTLAEDHELRTLSFRIDGVLISESGEHRVWYETSLSGAREFEVME